MLDNDLVLIDGRDPETRRQQTANPFSPVIFLLTLLASAGVVAYALFLLNPANRGDWLPYLLVMAAESILIFHAILAMWTILAGWRSSRSGDYHLVRGRLFGERTPTPQRPPTPDWPLQLDGLRGRLHHLLRRAAGCDPADGDRSPRPVGRAQHLAAGRRPLRPGA